MVQIEGKYKLHSNENFIPYLKGLGTEMTDELATVLNSLKPTLDVTVSGDKISLISDSGSSAVFTLGQTFEDEILSGFKVNSVATLSGNVLRIESCSTDSRKGVREYAFSDAGLVITYTGGKSNVTAKRRYDRI